MISFGKFEHCPLGSVGTQTESFLNPFLFSQGKLIQPARRLRCTAALERADLGQTPVPLLTHCGNLSKSLHLSERQFPPQQNGQRPHLTELLWS